MIAIGAVTLVWAQAQSRETPTFKGYPARQAYTGPVKLPDFGPSGQYSGTDLRCFGDPTAYSAMRVNFAGHFVLAACTCGSGCHYLFMWDAKTGRVYRDFPFGAIDVGPYSSARGQTIEYAGEQYRPDSTLLVLDGCLEGTCDCAERYYAWTGTGFRKISRYPDQLPVECQHAHK